MANVNYNGCEVLASSKGRGSGYGLFAKKDFKSGEIITFVERNIMDHTWQRLSGREEVDAFITLENCEELKTTTHIVSCGGARVSGLRVPHPGCGGGSFANHSYSPNAEFYYKAPMPNILLRVKRGHTISKGEEIYVNYFVPELSGVKFKEGS